jgi:poly(A) polymerase
MKLEVAALRDWPGMGKLLGALDAEGGATRFVGGSVRDTLLGIPVSDVDLATRLSPPEVMERLQEAGIKAVPTGLAHGTVTAVIGGNPVEVTTLRRDVATDGRRATIEYTDDWQEDAARRDFTINALFADPASGEIYDYFGGREDLAARRVRFIGDPLTRIAEDHLRILRFFRFHARFGSSPPDAAALDACTARANDLMALSRERIADELLKILALPDPSATIALMIDRRVLKPVLPEITAAGPLRDLIGREVAAGVAPAAIRRLAALLPPEPATAEAVAARLRLSNKAAKRLVSAAKQGRAAPVSAGGLAYEIGRDEAVDQMLLSGAAPADVAALISWERPAFPLRGRDLLEMGLPAGPEVARVLQATERRWIESGFSGDRDHVLAIAREEMERR